MEYTIERVKLGDEAVLAFIMTESWKAGFKDILRRDLSRFFSAKKNLFIKKNKKTVFYKSGSTDFSCFIMLF